jgi:segregation and condensation protein B
MYNPSMIDPSEIPSTATWELDVAVDLSGASGEQAADPPTTADLPPPTLVESSAPPPLHRLVEAMLFVGGPPLTAAKACEIIRDLSPEQFTAIVESLERDYRRQGRPYTIRQQEHGYELVLLSRYQRIHDKLYGGTREARLSQAAIDVLALVAYRQPATKQEIDSLRGADSGALLRQLVRRGLLTIASRADAGAKEVAYGTTPRFLQLFGLSSLDDLPQTQDLQKL